MVFEVRVFGGTGGMIPTGLSSLASGSFCLVSFSDSLTSCFRNPPGTTDTAGGGVAATRGVFSSFICGDQPENNYNLNPSRGKVPIQALLKIITAVIVASLQGGCRVEFRDQEFYREDCGVFYTFFAFGCRVSTENIPFNGHEPPLPCIFSFL